MIFCRRFGESDADLSLEDKMFMRFQKERVKKARNVSLFNLEGGDDVLTHKGNLKISLLFCDIWCLRVLNLKISDVTV